MNDQQAPTDDDIARMAREAGLQLAVSAEAYPVITGQLRRFAGFVAAAEREAMKPAIIKALQAHEKDMEGYGYFGANPGVSKDDYDEVASDAVAIRARGEA